MTTRRGKRQAEEAKWRRGNAELKVMSSKRKGYVLFSLERCRSI